MARKKGRARVLGGEEVVGDEKKGDDDGEDDSDGHGNLFLFCVVWPCCGFFWIGGVWFQILLCVALF